MKKIFFCLALILISVLFLSLWGQSEVGLTQQKLKEKTKMADVSPELREKAFGLLIEVTKEIENLKLPQNRIELKIRAADLLWEKDEKQARKIFLEAYNELVKSYKEVNRDCLTDDPSLLNCTTIHSLQTDLIENLVERDVKTAEDLLKTLKDTSFDARLFEQSIFEKYLTINPQKAFESAQNDIKEKELPHFNSNRIPLDSNSIGISDGIYGKLTLLYQANPELGAKLARKILEIIKAKRITSVGGMVYDTDTSKFSNANVTVTNININLMANTNRAAVNSNKIIANKSVKESNLKTDTPNTIDFLQVGGFLKQASELNNISKKQNPDQVPVLTETEMHELASMLIQSINVKQGFNFYEIHGIYPELVKYAPDEIQKLRRQITAAEWKEFESEIQRWKMPRERSRNVADILREIETTSLENRDELYAEATDAAMRYQCSELKDGFEYFLKIREKEKFSELSETYANLMQRFKAQNGDVKELQKILAVEKDPMKKVELISQTANALAQKGEVENAKKLFAEAQKLLPQKYKNSPQLRAYAVYAGALASIESNQSFSILEALISQVNETINTTANFYEFSEANGFIANNEFLLEAIEFQSAKHIYPSALFIKKLAQTDFERTVKLADKFSRPEVRLFVRWHFAESLLDKEAESREKNIADYREGCE